MICLTTTISARRRTRVTALSRPRAAWTILCRSVPPAGLPNVSYSTQVICLIASPRGRPAEVEDEQFRTLPALQASRQASAKSDLISEFSFPMDTPKSSKSVLWRVTEWGSFAAYRRKRSVPRHRVPLLLLDWSREGLLHCWSMTSEVSLWNWPR